MKKLMLAAATAAIAAGIFAAPTVYDYKAAVKHLYLKETPVTYEKQKVWIYTKYQKSTSLTGYLIMDQDGVTSPAIITNELGKTVYYTPSTGFDYGRNRGFLVVQNNSANAIVRHPKILPAVLDAKWMDTAFAKQGKATSGLAEGYLYVGGDAVEPVRPQLDAFLDADDEWYSEQRAEVPMVPSSAVSAGDDQNTSKTVYPGMVAVADYLWTSVYLFAGSTTKDAYYNGPNWFVRNKVYGPFGHFEYLWDQNLPELLRTGWEEVTEGEGDDALVLGYTKTPVNYYHDTWMNGSGVGKWSKGKITSEYCCGIPETSGSDDRVLETLSGNLKGGLFLCTENGIVVGSTNYAWYDWNKDDDVVIEWEDQFNTARLDTADLFETDVWQNDLWQDGFLEIETTDVIWGTWSIKINTKFYAEKGLYNTLGNITAKDVDNLQADKVEEILTPADIPTGAQEGTLTVMWDETLLGTIKAAALKLNKAAKWFDGSEIHTKSVKNRYDLPMLTPKFAIYYRLLWAEYDKAN